MKEPLVPCSACRRHVRMTERGCPFCRAPRSSLLGAVVSLAVGCGTPAPRTEPVTTRNELPPQAPDALVSDAALPDAPPDAPPPAVMVDASVDAAPPPPAVKHKGKITGRVLRKTAKGTTFPDVSIQLYNEESGEYLNVDTGHAKKGVYALTGLPPGTYKIWISDNQLQVDGTVDVVVRRDQAVKLDIDLSKVAMRRRPPKPYGAPPARRRVV